MNPDDLPVADPEVGEGRDAEPGGGKPGLGLLHEGGDEVDALDIRSHPSQEIGPVTRPQPASRTGPGSDFTQSAISRRSCSFVLSTDPNTEMDSDSRSV